MSDEAIQNLDADILIRAYAQGYFPMSDPDSGDLFWYHPDPRAILPLDGMHVSKSLYKQVRRGIYEIRFDTCFTTVMRECAKPRGDDNLTWIDDRFINAYGQLHEMGLAHSVEAWYEGQLVGGLYGVSLNGLFAGESMFSLKADASKVCLYHLVDHLNERGYALLDVQFQNPHITQFGVIEIPRDDYLQRLEVALNKQVCWMDQIAD